MLSLDIGGDVTRDGGVRGPVIHVNTVNCVGVMGAGVARAMADRFPAALAPYREMCREGTVYPGSSRLLPLGENRWMALLATKDHFRDPSRYDWVMTGLVLLAAEADALARKTGRTVTLRMPAPGCGLGGLEWPVVSRMMRAVLAASPRVDVHLCLSPAMADGFRTERPGPTVAGIGARDTPPDVQEVMADFGELCARHGWLVRSGGAAGADQAFGRGFSRAGNPSARASFTAWLHMQESRPPFGGRFTPIPVSLYGIARALHGAPDRIGLGGEIRRGMTPPGKSGMLMARNGFQILGDKMTDMTDAVVCWTEGGRIKGGTGQALRLAGLLGIPVVNLGAPGNRGLDAEGIRARTLEAIGARERLLRTPPRPLDKPLDLEMEPC